jgi:leucyl aminopeptidase
MPITLPFPNDDDLGVDQSMAFETVTKLEPVDASIIEAGKKLATGIFLTKDIVNAPHNVLDSLSLAETAKRIAEQSGGRIICEILDKEACEARCLGGFLGVARGSETSSVHPFNLHSTLGKNFQEGRSHWERPPLLHGRLQY